MKQSKKILSIILAMIMAFSVVSVIANAGLGSDKSVVNYDAVDDAELSVEQVADLALDAVDKLLVEADIYTDLSVLGKLNLRSVDSALSSIYDLINKNGAILWMAGDLGDLSVSSLKNVQRSGGDLNVLYALISFLNDNKGVISKIAYGLKTKNGIGFGVANSFIKLGSIETVLADLPTYLTKTVASLLLYGSYDYSDASYKSADTITLGTNINTIDKVLNVAVYNLLTDPQKYTFEGTGEAAVKVWDQSSYITTTDKVSTSDVDLNTNSILGILDNIIQVAYNDYGVAGLNNEIKRLLMEATGVDFVRLTDAASINVMKTAAGYVDTATATGAELLKVKNYAFDSQMLKVGNTWYLRTNGYEDVLDAEGNKSYDEEGNVIREKVDKFWKANTATANAFFNIVNWDYEFSSADFDFAALIAERGSIFANLNHILYTILAKAVNPAIVTVNDIWADGANSMVNANIFATAKWVVKTFTKDLFGKTSSYVDANGNATAEFVAAVDGCATLEDAVALIGLPFMNDAMPQLVMPKFDSGKQIEELGVLAVREFITDIAPTVNYDSYIFSGSSLTSSTGRVFANHTSDEWVNILINMGMDIAYTYLNNVTNFSTAIPEQTDITAEARWTSMLDAVIMWAVNYVGDGSTSVLNGFDPTTVASKEGPFAKLNYILNTLLPLGLVSGRACPGGQLDVSILFDQVKNILTTLDFSDLLTLFGRDNITNNILLSSNVINSVLDLVQRILALVAGTNLLPNTSSVSNLITQANLKTIISNLLGALNTIKAPLLTNALPIVAKFVSDWGGEQVLGSPDLELANNVATTNGSTTGYSVTVKNGSKGVWRGYMANGARERDNQYDYEVLSVVSSDAAVNTISTGANGKLSYGASKSFTFDASVPAGGKVVRFDVTYQVYDEDGNLMANGAQFVKSKYVFVSYNPKDEDEKNSVEKSSLTSYALKYIFIAGESINSLTSNTAITSKRNKASVGKKELKWTPSGTTTQNGITVSEVKQGSDYDVSNDTYLNLCPFSVNTSAFVLPKDGAVYTFNGTLYALSTSTNAPIKIFVYSDASKKLLDGIVENETGKVRKESDYNTGNILANAVLNTNVTTDELKQESNFTATGTNESGETVTVIDGAQAWANYVNAFNAAVRASYQPNYSTDYVIDFFTRYEALRVAAADLDYCKKTTAQLKEEGAVSIDTDVAALKTTLANIRDNTIDGKGYTDYMLYRWNRYTTWQNKAGDIISLAKAASYAVPDDQYFSYANISETDLRALVLGNQYSDYILALLKNYTEEDMKQRSEDLDKTKTNYSNYSGIDVAQISNMLTRTSQRLISRGALDATYINAEINSAKNQIGTVQGTYTDRSWARYSAALAAAETAAAGTAQVKMFDAKYELQVARNELKTADEEADYAELNDLMAQAEGVLANPALYNNSDADFGKVLAALGMNAIVNADGDNVYLFSGAAKDVDAKSYELGDQRKVDNAADALKAALANMRFKSTAGSTEGVAPVAPATGDVTIENNIVLEKDEKDVATLIASVATIAANKTVAEVKALFTTTAQGAGTTTLEVSTDRHYANGADVTMAYAGTNSTVTVFTTVGGVKVPVATIKIVVTGDVNGDGVIDVLDASATELVSNEHAVLAGCYFRAADTDSNDAIGAVDYSAVVNLALAH